MTPVKALLTHSRNGLTVSLFRPKVVIFVLCLAVFVCYANSLKNGFVNDDHYIIEVNRDTLTPAAALKAFTSSDILVSTDVTPYYRPLNRLSYLLDYRLFGLNPAGFHAVNLLLHLLCTVFVYLILFSEECGPVPAFIAALIFAVHPVNSESVNFVSGRNNILATLFVLASFFAYQQGEKSGRQGMYVVSGGLFFFGLLSKEIAYMLLPFLFFLKTLDRGNLPSVHRLFKADLGYLLPHLVFTLAYIVLRLFACTDNNYIGHNMTGIWQRMAKLVYILPKYVMMAIAPLRLNSYYVVPTTFSHIALFLVAGWIVLVAAIAYLLIVRNKTIVFGLAWIAFNFIPISNIIPIPSNPMADRYLYLPMVGVCTIAADRFNHIYVRFGMKRIIAIAGIFLLAFYGYTTFRRNTEWKDNFAVAASIVKVDPASFVGHYDLAYESILHGNREMAKKEWETALALEAGNTKAYRVLYNLAILSLQSHDDGKAETYFARAVRANNADPATHYAYARLLERQNRTELASQQYELFMQTVNLDSSHLIPEVNSRLRYLHKVAHTGGEKACANNRSER